MNKRITGLFICAMLLMVTGCGKYTKSTVGTALPREVDTLVSYEVDGVTYRKYIANVYPTVEVSVHYNPNNPSEIKVDYNYEKDNENVQ